mgnify:CR=1 FL=1
MNGRIPVDNVPPPAFALFSMDNPSSMTNVNDTLKNRQPSQVSQLFFTPANVELLQHAMRYRVWVETAGKHKIDKQSETDLLIVMRAMYLQHGRNLPYDIKGQVRKLNAFVLDYCVQRIVSEIGMYMRYRHDISHLPVPLDHAPLATTKGSRTLPGNPHIFNEMKDKHKYIEHGVRM